MDWNSLITEASIAELLSEEHAHLARPVRDAIALFLDGLPGAAQGAIVARQAALPAGASTSQRLRALALESPVIHKLGQALARDRRLHDALRSQLRTLEVLAPTVPVTTLAGTLREELGPLDALGVTLDAHALAEASVAVVIGFRHGRRQGVFKILKPGIERRLRLELALLGRVAEHLDARCAALGLPEFDYQETFRQVAEKLRDEVRLDVEQRHLHLAAVHYARRARVQVPALFPFCSRRVTAMERVHGRKVTDHRLTSRHERQSLASLLANAVLGDAVFSSSAQALFHGDPHAGNLLVTHDGRLAMLDWSLAGTLEKPEREAVVQLVVGALLLDAPRMLRMLQQLAHGRVPREDVLRAAVERALEPIRRGRAPDVAWLLGLLEDAMQRAGLRVRGDVLLLRKSLHTLDGVLADVGADGGAIERSLFAEALAQLALEWPRRLASPPYSRAFDTQLSSLDLAGLALCGPSLLARGLAGAARRHAA